MATIRQDAWTEEDDLILAEVTLRHIREGGTQLLAFEEVGEKIGRTSAACGFRWNSFVRKKYEAAIQIAKAQRQKRNQPRSAVREHQPSVLIDESPSLRAEGFSEDSVNFDAVIRFLRQHRAKYQDYSRQLKQLERDLEEKEEELVRLRSENAEMKSRLNNVENNYQVVNDDYKALIQIMDRARKMAFLSDERESELKPRFKMDANGNLERI